MIPLDVVRAHIIPQIDNLHTLGQAGQVCRGFRDRVRPALKVLHYFCQVLGKTPSIPSCLWQSNFSDLTRYKYKPQKYEDITAVAGLVRDDTKVKMLPLALEVAEEKAASDDVGICTAGHEVFYILVTQEFKPSFDGALHTAEAHLTSPHVMVRDLAERIIFCLVNNKYIPSFEPARNAGFFDALVHAQHAPAYDEALAHALMLWNRNKIGATEIFKELLKNGHLPAFRAALDCAKTSFCEPLFSALIEANYEPAMPVALEAAARHFAEGDTQPEHDPGISLFKTFIAYGSYIPALQEAKRIATINCQATDPHKIASSIVLFTLLVKAEYSAAYSNAIFACLKNQRENVDPDIHNQVDALHIALEEVAPNDLKEAIQIELQEQPESDLLLCQPPDDFPKEFEKRFQLALAYLQKEDEEQIARGLRLLNIPLYEPSLETAYHMAMKYIKDASPLLRDGALTLMTTLICLKIPPSVESASQFVLENLAYEDPAIKSVVGRLLFVFVLNKHLPLFQAAREFLSQNFTVVELEAEVTTLLDMLLKRKDKATFDIALKLSQESYCYLIAERYEPAYEVAFQEAQTTTKLSVKIPLLIALINVDYAPAIEYAEEYFESRKADPRASVLYSALMAKSLPSA